MILSWTVAVVGLGVWFAGRVARKGISEGEREEGCAVSIAAEVMASMRVVKALGAEERLAEKYKGHLARAMQVGTRGKVAKEVIFGECCLNPGSCRRHLSEAQLVFEQPQLEVDY